MNGWAFFEANGVVQAGNTVYVSGTVGKLDGEVSISRAARVAFDLAYDGPVNLACRGGVLDNANTSKRTLEPLIAPTDTVQLSTPNATSGSVRMNADCMIAGMAQVAAAGNDVTVAMNGHSLTIGEGIASTGAISVAMTAGSLTLGSTVNDGVLTAGVGGLSTLVLDNQSETNVLTVNASIRNGDSDLVTIRKTGLGTVALAGANSYSGGTTVNGGVLEVNQVNALGTGTVTVSGGTLDLNNLAIGNAIDYQSGTLANVAGAATTNLQSGATLNTNGLTLGGTTTVMAGATIKGTGIVNTLILNGGTIAPGNSPGAFDAGDTTWNGGTYQWELNQVTDNGGIQDVLRGTDPGFDFLNIKGVLHITSPTTVDITSLDLENLSGDPKQWDAGTTYSWTIATASEGISGLAYVGYTLANFTAPVAAGSSWTFSLADAGRNLVLTYSVPEPSALLFLVLGAAGLLRRRQRGMC
jgi:autotransporter-associated beta strand protein